MRQLKQMLRVRKAQMLGCGSCECLTLKCRRENDEFCNCGDATIGDMREYAENWFSTSTLMSNVTDPDTVQANADIIIEWAWEELRPFYNAALTWNTFEAYVTENGLIVDETWTCDDELANNNAAFTIYVSAMWAIDCKYLWLDNGDIINAAIIADYLDYINAD